MFTSSAFCSHHTANAPEMKLRSLVPISTFVYLWAIYTFQRSFRNRNTAKIGGLIVRKYKSLTDTWTQKLGTRPRSFISGNICFEFSVQCIKPRYLSPKYSSSLFCRLLFLFYLYLSFCTPHLLLQNLPGCCSDRNHSSPHLGVSRSFPHSFQNKNPLINKKVFMHFIHVNLNPHWD